MDLLPPSTSEDIPESTGMRFTVRSANSPSYSLTRRSGVRKRLTAENADDTDCLNTKEDLGFVYQKDINQSDAERNPQESGTVVGGSLALHGLGRTEGRGGNMPSRSMSLDLRSKSRSLSRTTTAGEPKLLGKTEIRGFEEQRAEIEKIQRGGTSSSSPTYFEDNHSVNHKDFADRVGKANTLPVRFKTESRPASRLDCPSGPQGGQSIKERIQKLFESAGDTTVGGTFPRRFSSCDDYSPVRKVTTIWAPKEENHPNRRKNNLSKDLGQYNSHKKTLHIPLNEGAEKRSRFLFSEDSNLRGTVTLTHTSDMQPRPQWQIFSPVSDDDKTPTNTPLNTPPFLSPVEEPEDFFPIADNTNKEKTKDNESLDLPPDTSYQNNLSDVVYSNVKAELPTGRKQLLDLNAWIAGLDPEYKIWNEYMGECEDDDESTQKDDDSNDSDSGDSSVTITSNMSQSENRSFSLSLSNLCNFSGTDVESDNDNDDWQLPGRRSASFSSDVSAFSCVSLLPTDELDKLVEEVKNLGDETLQDYDDVHVVVLHKEVGVGLGFSLAGGVDQNKPVTVHKVFNSGVAAKEGSISEGDHVLSINGTAFSKSTHLEALRTLKRAKSREMAVVVLRKGDLSQSETQYETGQRVCIQLEKNSVDLGFSLMGGVGSNLGNKPLTVQKIFRGGPIDKMFPGDEILEIQGFSVVGRRRLEVWNFIKTLTSGPVEVVLRRPVKVTH
uniref:Si:dkey-92i15.4 n=1 Tax=Xiphophorus couchianus TaxID=32473 RepID=A0A3B5MZV0_9TELE